jgi:hypothetical protein
MTLRNRGNPSGFSRLAAPMLERAMRRATTKDLARLKVILESGDLDASRRSGVRRRRCPAIREPREFVARDVMAKQRGRQSLPSTIIW